MNKLNSSLFLFLIMLGQFSDAQTNSGFPQDDFGKKASGKYADVNGIRLYYEIYGKGEPLLLIHGNGGSIRSMRHQIPFFSKHYQVIAVDSRAQGKSIDKGDSLSFELMADDFNELLTGLNLDSCFVIGWSDGGINGLLLAQRHPDKVKKLAITGANLWPDTTAIDSYSFKGMESYYESLVNEANPTDQVKNDKKLIALNVFQPNIDPRQLRQIKCPTLVIGGDHDVILPEHTLLIAKSIPKSYLWILPNSGHATVAVYKNLFNTQVMTFFKNPFRKIEGDDRSR